VHVNERISVQYYSFAGLPKLIQIVFARVCGAREQSNDPQGVNESGVPFHRKTLWSSHLIHSCGTSCRLQVDPVFGVKHKRGFQLGPGALDVKRKLEGAH
jgi:hypothetical protein